MAEDGPKLRLIARGPTAGCCTDGSCKPGTCMVLAEGVTCDDCLWFRSICQPMGYSKAGERTCDFFPCKFVRDVEAKA